jgi:hypothetical protein
MRRGYGSVAVAVAAVSTVLLLGVGCTSSKSGTATGGTTTIDPGSGTTAEDPTAATARDAEGTTATSEPQRPPSGDTSETAYLAALEQGFASDDEFPADKAGCAAQAMVDAVGVDTFVQNGVSPDDLSDEGDLELDFALSEQQARDLVDGLDDCVDLGALMAQGFADDSDLTDEQKACLERELTTEVVKNFMVRILTTPPDDPEAGFEVFEEIFTVMADCGLDPLSSFEDG